MNTLVVRNTAQQALFEHELKEQLHTGHWKNTRPLGHWQPWCDAEVVVAGADEPIGRNFRCPRDNYDLTSKKLLQRAARRMVTKVKIIRVFGELFYGTIVLLYDANGSWHGMPTGVGEYHDQSRATINALLAHTAEPETTLKNIRRLVNDFVYTERELKADLKDLKAIMRTVIGGSTLQEE